MIASIRGKLIYSNTDTVVVECGGVGLKCTVTKTAFYKLPAIGEEVFLHTFLVVREDAMDLYGFSDLKELETFKLITSVNGVGAKIGIAILSELNASQIMLSIASNDPKTLTAASGVGIKLAQRIILELKDKVGSLESDSNDIVITTKNAVANTNTSEAIEALIALGYNKSEASLAVGKLDTSLSTDELIKQALKSLARGL